MSTTPGSTTGDGVGPLDPLLDLTGDPVAADLLRRNLAAIAERERGTATGALVADVLAGRRPVRDLELDPAFMTIARSGVDEFRRHMASLDPDERRRLVEQAEHLVEDGPDR
jgi:hypothetical protein